MLVPLSMMLERVRRAKGDSSTTLFFELLYLGEFVTKLTVAGFVPAIQDDRNNHRYRLQHKLVRASSVGEWTQALDDILEGTASSLLLPEAKEDRTIFTKGMPLGSWQHQVVTDLAKAAACFSISTSLGQEKIALRRWFDLFPEFRNKTRGHGSPRVSKCAEAVGPFERSLNALIENHPLFKREWAFLRQNLSGKYHVVALIRPSKNFDILSGPKSREIKEVFGDGLYIYFDKPRAVDLVRTDPELSDFYVPNGAFTGSGYEEHSLLTDSRRIADATPYLAPAIDRPDSETSGRGELTPIGKVWTNLPPAPDAYVERYELEENVRNFLRNDRHPIITLVGRGGIGKTSLALRVLHSLTNEERFGAMIWFSARDIDLTQAGPKLTKPDILTETDISVQFSAMLRPSGYDQKGFNATTFMTSCMAKSQLGEPILFVFDNFETVRNPVDVFNWIDTNIRLPNKALITTRSRDFKADYPVEVPGMARREADELIEATAKRLGKLDVFSRALRDDIYDQSDGHPYVIKIVVGEISDSGRATKPERIINGKEDILQALFERTFNNLTTGAKRIFLTLCGWRSYVPQLALEALVLRNQNDSMKIIEGLDELDRMSLIQRRRAQDGEDFIAVPLAAALFGRRKLATYPLRTVIELDVGFLQELGPTSAASVPQGVIPHIKRLARSMAEKIADGRLSFSDARALMEFLASRTSEAWILLADLAAESPDNDAAELERESLRRFLEADPNSASASRIWERLGKLYRAASDVFAACDAFARAFSGREVRCYEISNIANWLNNQRDAFSAYDVSERRSVIAPLAALMDDRISEANATDLSRLAWLHLHAGDDRRSEVVARLGLQLDPENIHCQRLMERLTRPTTSST